MSFLVLYLEHKCSTSFDHCFTLCLLTNSLYIHILCGSYIFQEVLAFKLDQQQHFGFLVFLIPYEITDLYCQNQIWPRLYGFRGKWGKLNQRHLKKNLKSYFDVLKFNIGSLVEISKNVFSESKHDWKYQNINNQKSVPSSGGLLIGLM